MTIVFFGNTKYSQVVETILHTTYKLAAVVTIPARMAGRNKQLTPSPVETYAKEQSIPVILADKLDSSIYEKIKQLKPDFIVVADYGLILPDSFLTLPKTAAINVHHSLLPKYRGSSPVPSAILAGEKITGVTIISMAAKMDEGDILAQESYTMTPTDTTDSVLTILNNIGGKLACDVIRQYSSDQVKPQIQDENQASYTKQFTKEDGFIDLANPPSMEQLDRMIRAYFPWPGVWTKVRIKNIEVRIKLLPGGKIQVEGKNAVDYKDFMNGYKDLPEELKSLLQSKN